MVGVVSSFNVANMIAQTGRYFSIGEFLKSCMIKIAEDIVPFLV
jgi:hypothetical protein